MNTSPALLRRLKQKLEDQKRGIKTPPVGVQTRRPVTLSAESLEHLKRRREEEFISSCKKKLTYNREPVSQLSKGSKSDSTISPPAFPPITEFRWKKKRNYCSEDEEQLSHPVESPQTLSLEQDWGAGGLELDIEEDAWD